MSRRPRRGNVSPGVRREDRARARAGATDVPAAGPVGPVVAPVASGPVPAAVADARDLRAHRAVAGAVARRDPVRSAWPGQSATRVRVTEPDRPPGRRAGDAFTGSPVDPVTGAPWPVLTAARAAQLGPTAVAAFLAYRRESVAGPPSRRTRPVCPVCHLHLPIGAGGRCDVCGDLDDEDLSWTRAAGPTFDPVYLD